MPLITAQELLQSNDHTKAIVRGQLDANPDYNNFHFSFSDLSQCAKVLDVLRERVTDVGYFSTKDMRPWHLVGDYYNRLDETQPWLGWEMETSWRSNTRRAEALGWVWDNMYGCGFDLEGGAMFATEITLPPQEMSLFESNEADFSKMVQHLSTLDERGLGGNVMDGTHLNFSLPCFRDSQDKSHNAVKYVTNFLNNSMQSLTHEHRATLFGRSPTYGGAYHQDRYIELKVFRTTYSYEQFQQYVKRGVAIVKLAQWYVDKLAAGYSYNRNEQCSNLFEVLENGALPELGIIDRFILGGWNDGAGQHEYVDGAVVDHNLPAEDGNYWNCEAEDTELELYNLLDKWGAYAYDDYDDECSCNDDDCDDDY